MGLKKNVKRYMKDCLEMGGKKMKVLQSSKGADDIFATIFHKYEPTSHLFGGTIKVDIKISRKHMRKYKNAPKEDREATINSFKKKPYKILRVERETKIP